jgi:cytoskeletal protein CcmA (bactofilin family)
MWRKEEQKSQGVPEMPVSQAAGIPQPSTPSSVAPASASATGSALPGSALPVSPRAAACISQGIRIKGEITGKEDLFVDGTVEGKLDLGNASCTIGPNGKVKADISAREVIVRGQVDGKIDGVEKVQLWNSGRVIGEVRTERLAIEDGAVLRGKVEAGKPHSSAPDARKSANTPEKSKGNVEAGTRAAVI